MLRLSSVLLKRTMAKLVITFDSNQKWLDGGSENVATTKQTEPLLVL